MQYIRHTRAWYYSATQGDWSEEFYLTEASDEAGVRARRRTAEVFVRWYPIDKLEHSPKVEAFMESWDFLADLSVTVLRHLNDHEMTPDDFEDVMRAHGFEDITPVKSPYNRLGISQ